MEVLSIILVFIGIFEFPIFTLGCVLLHFHHEFLGIIAILHSLSKYSNDNDD